MYNICIEIWMMMLRTTTETKKIIVNPLEQREREKFEIFLYSFFVTKDTHKPKLPFLPVPPPPITSNQQTNNTNF